MSFPDPEGDVLLDGVWVAARAASFALTDPGMQSGLGVFETLAVRAGRAMEAAEHVARLGRSAARLDVPLPPADEVVAAVGEVAARVAGGFGWLKIIATRAGRLAVFAGTMDPADEGRPATAIQLPWRRSPSDPLSGVKSLNYAPYALGLEQARRQGADEALWLNSRGHLAEGCSSNLFVVKGRKVFTPALRDGILGGVTRTMALEAVREMGLPVHEGKVRVTRLEHADEAFLTSSLKGVRPLVAFEGRPVGRGVPGVLTLEVGRRVAAMRYRDFPAAAEAVAREE